MTAFYGGWDPENLTGAAELLRIWTQLVTDAERRKILDFARAVAAEKDGSPASTDRDG